MHRGTATMENINKAKHFTFSLEDIKETPEKISNINQVRS